MRSVHEWLADYGSSHRNATNKLTHWIGIPLIVFSLAGLLWAIPLFKNLGLLDLNAAVVTVVLFTVYYALLSIPLALGMLVVFAAMLLGLAFCKTVLGNQFIPAMLGVFIVGWILQFIGHKFEGKKPSFFKDLQFLMIGPLWLLADVYRRLGLRI